MPLASLTVPGLDRFDFLGWRTEDGTIPDEPEWIGENLESSGIDFERSRLDHRIFPRFSARTLAECSDYPAARNFWRQYKRSLQRLATLEVTIRGIPMKYSNVLIHQVQARCLPTGPISTAGTLANPQAGITADWVLQLTEAP